MLSKGRLIYKQVKRKSKKMDVNATAATAGDESGQSRKEQLKNEMAEEDEAPREYEVFLDIKKSYENSLAKMDTLVKRLQNENRVEKTKRLKYQKIAEDIQERETRIVRSLQAKFSH